MNDRSEHSIRGIFFDLFGTLFVYGDMNAAWADWLVAIYTGFFQHGLSLSQEEFALQCDRFLHRPEPRVKDDGFTVLERRIHALSEEFGIIVDPTSVKSIALSAVSAWHQYITPDPECIPVLKLLRADYTIALISNFDHPVHVYQILRKAGLKELFDEIIISGEVGPKKPDPGIFHVAFERTGMKPDEVIYVGDSDEDVQGARAAGVIPVVIKRPYDKRLIVHDFHADCVDGSGVTSKKNDDLRVIASLSELLTFVNKGTIT